MATKVPTHETFIRVGSYFFQSWGKPRNARNAEKCLDCGIFIWKNHTSHFSRALKEINSQSKPKSKSSK